MKSVERGTTSTTSLPGTLQFSLSELMLGTLMLGVLLGAMRLAPPDQQYVVIAITVAVMAGLFIALAVLGKVRLVPMLAILGVLGLIFGHLLQPSYSGRGPLPCHSKLRQIATAMTLYEGQHSVLPPAFIADAQGKPMHSWRVLILPQLGEWELYDQYRFDEPWDGPNNKKLHDRIVDIYRCPHDHPSRWRAAARQTSYVVITGPGTVFPGRRKISVADVANGDGASSTILVVEVHDSGVHWMEPRDLDLATMDLRVNGTKAASISSKHPGGAMVAMVDGSVRHLDDKTPTKDVKRLILIDDDKRAAKR